MAIIAVIVAIVVTDFAIGGADEPEPENLALLGPGAAAATPIPPTPVGPSPTVPPTLAPTPSGGPIAEMRDAKRKEDLDRIRSALEEYNDEEDEYPSTGGNAQTTCNYPDIDALCKLKDLIDPIPTDPRGDPGTNGYWYVSDGETFTLIAEMELAANATPERCDESLAEMLEKSNLYCLRDSD
jgi:type II secretory pathway pseudopilin PulG